VHLLSSTAPSTVNGFSTLKLDYKAGGAPSTAGAQIMFNQGYHSGNPDYTQPVGAIRGWKTGSDTAYGGGLQFLYQPDSAALGVLVGMTLTGGGNVGIGTTTPSRILHVTTPDSTVTTIGDASGIRLETRTTPGETGAEILFSGYSGQTYGTAAIGIIQTDNGDAEASDLYFATKVGTAAGDRPIERMRITKAGSVGIGTATPAATLDVSGTGAIKIPVGTTAQRPASSVAGMIRFNSDSGKVEYHNGIGWSSISALSLIAEGDLFGYGVTDVITLTDSMVIGVYCDQNHYGWGLANTLAATWNRMVSTPTLAPYFGVYGGTPTANNLAYFTMDFAPYQLKITQLYLGNVIWRTGQCDFKVWGSDDNSTYTEVGSVHNPATASTWDMTSTGIFRYYRFGFANFDPAPYDWGWAQTVVRGELYE